MTSTGGSSYQVIRVTDDIIVDVITDVFGLYLKEGIYKFTEASPGQGREGKGIAFYPIRHYYVKRVM
jgi:hypothetical protein